MKDWKELIGKDIVGVEQILYKLYKGKNGNDFWREPLIADKVILKFSDGTTEEINGVHHWSRAGICLGPEED